ncbi:MAG: LacI family transcriptional regulator [Actinomycetota bacterium]|nr:LacI family transcriptional regulator [Actinomycetota bacterium]
MGVVRRTATPSIARPTLESVAALAGVSRGTASRALNGGVNVSPRALEAVQQAAERLGYRPNLAARSLVLGRSGSVGLMVSESDDRLFNDPFFAAIIRGVHSVLAAQGVQLVLTLAQTSGERTNMVRFASGRHLDGILLISMPGGDPLPGSLLSAGLPVVLCGRGTRESAASGLWWVDADNRGGARLAVQHLLDSGRRKVATVAGPRYLAVGRDRLAGWRDVLKATTGDAPSELVERGDFLAETGYEGTRRLLERVPDVDAIFAGADLIALGVLQALRECGRRVPDDVAVIGFDDIPAAARIDPPLTTVKQPIEAIGTRMAEMLMHRIAGDPVDPPWAILPTELVLRTSA